MCEMNKICEQVLCEELMPALGCTEPIAVAYAAAKARELLGCVPTAMRVDCSGNIIKNVMGVTVPNSGGMRGVAAAAVLGALGGNAAAELEVLESVTPEVVAKATQFLAEKRCECHHAKGEESLYILVAVCAENESAVVEIRHAHTNITRMEKNEKVVFEGGARNTKAAAPKERMNVQGIYEYARTGDVEPVRDILEKQIAMNKAIAEEGMEQAYGANVGSILRDEMPPFAWCRLLAYAAAGSDARMAGCTMPVVINSGSGNQGLTVSMPIVQRAEQLSCPREKLLRALMLGNLISLHIKAHIGNLSAFCGAVSAACGAVAGIAFLEGRDLPIIEGIITNTLCTAGGLVCDGAKASCASKIATSLFSALVSYEMVKNRQVFEPHAGLAGENVEDTIDRIGRMCRRGMESTDEEILSIMLGKAEPA